VKRRVGAMMILAACGALPTMAETRIERQLALDGGGKFILDTDVGAMMRHGGSDYREAGDLPENQPENLPENNETALAEWLSRHPESLERPIVVDRSSGRAVLGRPPENVLDLLGGGREDKPGPPKPP